MADGQGSVKRTTEGTRPSLSHGKGPETAARRRGRPPGSKNKPKSLVPADLAASLLDVMKERVSPEHYEYLKGVIQRGEAISTVKELDVLITLVRASAMPYLALEAMPVPILDEDGQAVLDDDGKPYMKYRGIDRDATDRLKLLNSLLSLKDNIEKRKDDDDEGDGTPVIVKVFAKRGIDQDRLRVLVGIEQGAPALPEPRVVEGEATALDA